MAITLTVVGSLSALGMLAASANLDQEMRERSIALRAAFSKMEAITAYDYNDDLNNFIAHWTTAPFNTFAVAGLTPPAGVAPGTTIPAGTVTVDSTDPLRVVVTVSVHWVGRKGPRAYSIPTVVTEVKK